MSRARQSDRSVRGDVALEKPLEPFGNSVPASAPRIGEGAAFACNTHHHRLVPRFGQRDEIDRLLCDHRIDGRRELR